MREKTFYLLWLLVCLPCLAQSDHLTWWANLDFKKPLHKGWQLQLHSEWHQNVTNHQTDMWLTSPMVGKRINDWLRADIGWIFAQTRTKGNGTTPSFYRTMHRPFIQFIANHRMGNVRASFREYWEWVWLPQKELDFGVRNGRAYHELRHRLKFEWLLPSSRFTPYAYTEARHYSVMEQARISFGTFYKINKHTAVDVGWFYQDKRRKANCHVFIATYSVTL